MTKIGVSALLCAGLVASAFSTSARANVIYDLTLTPQGGAAETGVLTLNYSSLSAVDNLNPVPLTAFVSFQVSGLFGYSFDITSQSQLTAFYGQTGPTGSLVTNMNLDNNNQSPQLDINGTSFEIYVGPNYASYVGQGSVSYGAPSLATTPLPAALPMFAGGLGMVGFLARRKKRKAAA